jgi:DNA-binding transcriptional LysR family regulator
MELGELKTFVMVAAEHSFSRAAIKLRRTQPAVSQAIRRLEEDLGERLFDRSTKSATLTQAGDALLPEAIGLLRMADKAAPTIRRISQRHRAVLRIGGDEAAAHVLHSARLVTLAGVPLPTPVSTCATTDSALPTGSFLIMPGVDSLKQAVANGLGIGIVPRAAVSSLNATAGLVVIPLSAARVASALTLVYRDNEGQPNAVEDFVEVLRNTREDRASRKAPIAMRVSR